MVPVEHSVREVVRLQRLDCRLCREARTREGREDAASRDGFRLARRVSDHEDVVRVGAAREPERDAACDVKIGWAPFVYCRTSGRVSIFSRYAYAFPSPTHSPTRAVSPLGMIHPKKPGAISLPMNNVTNPGSPRTPVISTSKPGRIFLGRRMLNHFATFERTPSQPTSSLAWSFRGSPSWSIEISTPPFSRRAA